MSLKMDLDLDGLDIDQAEKGNAVPKGWYKVRLEDVHEDPKNEGTILLVYVVLGGAYDGVKIYDRLYDPSKCDDTDKAKACENRRGIVAKRLGLLVKDPSDPAGKRYMVDVVKCASGRLDLEAAIGDTVFLKMIEKRVKNDKTGKWETKDRAEPEFANPYPPDDDRVPAELRADQPTGTANENGHGAASAPVAPPQPKVYDDL